MPRLSRPATIRDEDLLAAARVVFIERGFQATTAEVAHHAGVSEGTLFKRFGSKAGLFHACMHVSPTSAPWLVRLEAEGRAEPPRPVRDVLLDTGREVLEFYRLIVPTLMLRWSNPGADGAVGAANVDRLALEPAPGVEPPPLVAARRMTEWFAAEMARGRLPRLAPEVPARIFLGTLFNYAFLETLQRAHSVAAPDPEVFLSDLVGLILRGLEKSPEQPE